VALNNITSARNILQTQQQSRAEEQILANKRSMNLGSAVEARVMEALELGQQSAIEDTLEDISLTMGSRLKELKSKAEKQTDSRFMLLEQLAESTGIAAGDIPLGDVEALEAMRKEGHLSDSEAMMFLASWQANDKLGGKKRKQLAERLGNMLADNPDWALEMFGELELGSLTPETMQPLRQIMQRFKRPRGEGESENELWQWFEEIEAWPERQSRIRVLLRTLALELSQCTDQSQQDRLAETILDLKKLLIFLGVEERCLILATTYLIDSTLLMKGVLKTIEQIWINETWFVQQLNLLSLPAERQLPFLRQLIELIRYLPDPCFIDEEQHAQIIQAVTHLYDHLSEEE